jgi:hypothetical protein
MLSEALDAGSRLHIRCAWGRREGPKSFASARAGSTPTCSRWCGHGAATTPSRGLRGGSSARGVAAGGVHPACGTDTSRGSELMLQREQFWNPPVNIPH